MARDDLPALKASPMQFYVTHLKSWLQPWRVGFFVLECAPPALLMLRSIANSLDYYENNTGATSRY
jgi:hypothetical protein